MNALRLSQRLSLDNLVASFRAFSAAKALGVVFVAGFVIRLVPELLAGATPIGFDTVYYAAMIKGGVVWANWDSFFTSTWLLHALTVPLYNVFQVDPFLLLKIIAPALYGLNVAGIYWMGRKMLGWDVKLCLVAAGLYALQLASLRISWDLLRNTLGMGLLLFTLPLVGKLCSRRDFAVLAFLSLLTVFAHEFAGLLLVAIVLGVVVWRFVRKRFTQTDGLTVLAVLPAIAVFSIGIFLRFLPISYGVQPAVLSTGEGSVGRFLFFVNYFNAVEGVFHYTAYTDLLINVFLLFVFLYISYLFLVLKGFFRNTILNIWTMVLLIGSFGCLVWPFFALDLWSRWMFMLVYPFAFYTVNGLSRILQNPKSRKSFFGLFWKKTVGLAVCATFVLGSIYLATPILLNTTHVGVFYLPYVSAYFSSAPSVPYQDVGSVTQAMIWLDENMEDNSCIAVNTVFANWKQLYIDDSHASVHFWNDAELASETALDNGYDFVYLVWWNEPTGWYELNIPKGYITLKDFGRISVYEHLG